MKPLNILIVEDEAVIVEDLRQKLQGLGYGVVGTAMTGEEAIREATATRPDLILMDIRLKGGMDGVETAARLRERFDIPLIYLTAYSDDQTLERAKLTEPMGYILKPLEERELRASVEVAVYKHEVERKLKRLERWLAATLSSIGDAVISTDLERRVTYLNQVAEKLTGWPQSDARGENLSEVLKIVDSKTGQPLEGFLRRVLEEGIVVDLADGSELVARDGHRIPIDDSAAPIRDEKGQTTGIVVVFRDITERKRAEAGFRKSQDLLRQAQKMEAVGRLAGGVAHDFNNLMTVIIGYGELSLAQFSPSHSVYPGLQEIQKAARSASTLTHQLMAFSRKQVLRPTVLDLNGLVSTTERMLKRLVGDDIILTTRLRAARDRVKVDPVQFQQVLLNLAANARDAMPRGGSLMIETSETNILDNDLQRYDEMRPGPHVLIAVTDTGCGMDAETLSHVFEPFFTTKEVGGGTGLGLATVYGIIKQSGGHVTVYSEPGHGSTFKIYLPLAADEAVTPSPAGPPKKAAGGDETILVVDDSAPVRMLIKSVLALRGYTVIEAADGKEALERFRSCQGPVHLVVSDVVMPGMSGPELVEQLIAWNPSLKVLFVSGYSGAAVGRWGQLRPGTWFLEKPFSPEALAERVRAALDSTAP